MIPRLGPVVPKQVVNWFDNGNTDQFLQSHRGQAGQEADGPSWPARENHLIRTPNGWREAGKLKVGDHVLEALPHYLSDFQWDALRGTLMGDGCLSPTRSGHAARFRFGHCEKQTAYADWKASLFSNLWIEPPRPGGRRRHLRLPAAARAGGASPGGLRRCGRRSSTTTT